MYYVDAVMAWRKLCQDFRRSRVCKRGTRRIDLFSSGSASVILSSIISSLSSGLNDIIVVSYGTMIGAF